MQTLSSADAQNRFGELLDQAQREPVCISRRGRVVAFVLSPLEYESMARGTSTPQSAELLAVARAAVASFRGSGKGGSAKRLLTERKAERRTEAEPRRRKAPAKPRD